MPKKPFIVRLNLHFRADSSVVLYMNGKKCIDGDLDSVRKVGQKLVDEGKARWTHPTFHKKDS